MQHHGLIAARPASHALPRAPARGGWAQAIAVLLFAVVLAGCAGLPARTPADAPASTALADAGSTTLGRIAADALHEGAGSAFTLLPLAATAFETRVELARRAERTLDVQSFVFEADEAGTYLLGVLREAAGRGVRVRLLLDDLHSASAEPLLSDLAAFPNVEVRLINPFVRARSSSTWKLLTSLDDLGRVNQRMHNKLFAADNALAVFGGRNIGVEYFMRASRGGNFVDLDMLAAGSAVRQFSEGFDHYWNSPSAWPIDLIVAPRGNRAERQARFQATVSQTEPPPDDPGVPERLKRYATVPTQLRAGKLQLTPAEAEVLIDPVDKLTGSRIADRAGTVRAGVAQAMRAAQSEVFVISPYFIPGALGMEAMETLRRRGVRLRLLTNSLAATDEPAVHAGYVSDRKRMVEIGVEVFELSPTLAREAGRLGRFGTSTGALHAKIAVIDHARLFVGSMNLDGRSERYNTEDGVIIDSPELARDFLQMIDFESSTWRLRLSPAGELEWVHDGPGGLRVETQEPEADAWRSLVSRILGALLPHDWL